MFRRPSPRPSPEYRRESLLRPVSDQAHEHPRAGFQGRIREVVLIAVKRRIRVPALRFDADEKPGVSNLLTIYSALSGRTILDLEASYVGKGYGDLKKDLAEVVIDFVTPFRNRTLELLEDPESLGDVLEAGRDRATEVAEKTLDDVYDRVGFVPPRTR